MSDGSWGPKKIWEPSSAECVICQKGVHLCTISPGVVVCYCFTCKAMRGLSSDGRVATP